MNFQRIATGLDVAPLVAALDAHPELWRQITIRQSYAGSAHSATECIFLRGPKAFSRDAYFFDISSYDYPALTTLQDAVLPLIQPVLHDALQITELGRVMLVRLRPGGEVTPHVDEGTYAEHFSRFHIPVSGSGATLTVCGESQEMTPGDCWWFQHRRQHWASNPVAAPSRVHMIIDAVSPYFQVE